MPSHPLVAVSATIRHDDDMPRVRLNAAYLSALEKAQCVPLVTPPMTAGAEPEHILAERVLTAVDGLLLTGGDDVNPARYGAQPHPKLGVVSNERDRWEIALLHEAKKRRLPTLAICRGVQLLNVAFGGTLVQDIESEIPGALPHSRDDERRVRVHPIEIVAESKVGRAVGVTSMQVNSVHHQAVERPADTFRVVAHAPDGVIEALEYADDRAYASAADAPEWWCVGVQWHPEELVDAPEAWDRGLFNAFASALRSRPGA